MKDYNNAFLGFMLAGVLMLVIGLGLLLAPRLGPVVEASSAAERAEPGSNRLSWIVRSSAR